jgi:sn-glycerol 3-phosphate transport system substrate-binding protein
MVYLTNTENAADWQKTTGYIAIRNSANEMMASEGYFTENPNQTVAAQQLADSQVTPATSGALVGGFPAIRNVVTAAIDRVLLTDDDPKAVLDEAATEANTIIEEYNLLNAPQ